jgi:16S rRNA (cytosine1402-N4)-methyltransferase
LAIKPGGRYIDCTVGGGGHAASILKNSSPGGQLLGLDADPEAIGMARAKLGGYRDSVLLLNENFINLWTVAKDNGFYPVNGILFDLGLSSFQLSNNARGFSFQHESALDMRLNPEQRNTADDIINELPENELARLIKTYGEESYSHKIAHRIVEKRPIKTTLQLARTVELAVGKKRGKIHPATRTFQALRIAVNQELQHLEIGLEKALDLLGYGGRLVVISYHSLEDRIVKRFMHRESNDCICPPHTPTCICEHKAKLNLVNKRVIRPSVDEVRFNPRSRSARLRAAERIIEWDAQTTMINRGNPGLTAILQFSEN